MPWGKDPIIEESAVATMPAPWEKDPIIEPAPAPAVGSSATMPPANLANPPTPEHWPVGKSYLTAQETADAYRPRIEQPPPSPQQPPPETPQDRADRINREMAAGFGTQAPGQPATGPYAPGPVNPNDPLGLSEPKFQAPPEKATELQRRIQELNRPQMGATPPPAPLQQNVPTSVAKAGYLLQSPGAYAVGLADAIRHTDTWRILANPQGISDMSPGEAFEYWKNEPARNFASSMGIPAEKAQQELSEKHPVTAKVGEAVAGLGKLATDYAIILATGGLVGVPTATGIGTGAIIGAKATLSATLEPLAGTVAQWGALRYFVASKLEQKPEAEAQKEALQTMAFVGFAGGLGESAATTGAGFAREIAGGMTRVYFGMYATNRVMGMSDVEARQDAQDSAVLYAGFHMATKAAGLGAEELGEFISKIGKSVNGKLAWRAVTRELEIPNKPTVEQVRVALKAYRVKMHPDIAGPMNPKQAAAYHKKIALFNSVLTDLDAKEQAAGRPAEAMQQVQRALPMQEQAAVVGPQSGVVGAAPTESKTVLATRGGGTPGQVGLAPGGFQGAPVSAEAPPAVAPEVEAERAAVKAEIAAQVVQEQAKAAQKAAVEAVKANAPNAEELVNAAADARLAAKQAEAQKQSEKRAESAQAESAKRPHEMTAQEYATARMTQDRSADVLPVRAKSMKDAVSLIAADMGIVGKVDVHVASKASIDADLGPGRGDFPSTERIGDTFVVNIPTEWRDATEPGRVMAVIAHELGHVENPHNETAANMAAHKAFVAQAARDAEASQPAPARTETALPAPVEAKPAQEAGKAASKPLTLYHGTRADFADADIAGGQDMYGIHLTTDETAAKDYGKVKRYELDPKAKVLDLSEGDTLWQFMQEQGIIDAEDAANPDLENYATGGRLFQYDLSSNTHLADDVAKAAESLGYDVVTMGDDLGGKGGDVAYVVVNKAVLKAPAAEVSSSPPVAAKVEAAKKAEATAKLKKPSQTPESVPAQTGETEKVIAYLTEKYGPVRMVDAHNAPWMTPDGKLVGNLADHQESAVEALAAAGLSARDEYEAVKELQRTTGIARLTITDSEVNFDSVGQPTAEQVQAVGQIARKGSLDVVFDIYAVDGKTLVKSGNGMEALNQEAAPQAAQGPGKAAEGKPAKVEAAKKAEATAKEPWEMTAKEWADDARADKPKVDSRGRPIKIVPLRGRGFGSIVLRENDTRYAYETKMSYGKKYYSFDRGDTWKRSISEAVEEAKKTGNLSETWKTNDPLGQHRVIVKKALSAGDPVPAAVLADYKNEPWAKDALAKLEKPAKRLTPAEQRAMQEEYTALWNRNMKKDGTPRANAKPEDLARIDVLRNRAKQEAKLQQAEFDFAHDQTDREWRDKTNEQFGLKPGQAVTVKSRDGSIDEKGTFSQPVKFGPEGEPRLLVRMEKGGSYLWSPQEVIEAKPASAADAGFDKIAAGMKQAREEAQAESDRRAAQPHDVRDSFWMMADFEKRELIQSGKATADEELMFTSRNELNDWQQARYDAIRQEHDAAEPAAPQAEPQNEPKAEVLPTKADIEAMTFDGMEQYAPKTVVGIGRNKGKRYRAAKIVAVDENGQKRTYNVQVSDSGERRIKDEGVTKEQFKRDIARDYAKLPEAARAVAEEYDANPLNRLAIAEAASGRNNKEIRAVFVGGKFKHQFMEKHPGITTVDAAMKALVADAEAKAEPKAEATKAEGVFRSAADKARERIRQRSTGERPTMGLDPGALADWVLIGLDHAERIIRKLGKLTRKAWTAAMREENPDFKPAELRQVWGEIVKAHKPEILKIIRESKPGKAGKSIAPPSREVTSEVTAPAAEAEPTIGIKNAAVEEQLAARGLLPPRHGPAMSFEQAIQEAATAFSADPFVGKKLVDDLLATPRPATGYEDAVLLHEMNRLTHEVDRAEEAYLEATKADDKDALASAKNRLDAVTADYVLAGDVVTMVGTESSHSLGHRRMMMKLDYSLAAMERRAEVAQAGKPLADKERQLIVDQAKEIASLEQKIADVEVEAQKLRQQHEIDAKIKQTVHRQKKAADLLKEPTFGASNRIFTRDRATAAKVSLFAMLRGPQMALAPGGMEKLITLGGFYVEGGLRNFKQWKAQILADAGDLASEIEPDLAEAWKQITDQLPTIDRPAIVKAMKNAAGNGRALPEMAHSINKLAENLIESGIHDREQLITALHEILVEIDPAITRRETMDALSGYGDYRPLNADPIKAELRDYKGQLQQVAKLQDMQAGAAPAKTGPERRIPSDEERRLIQQVNETKHKGGFVVTDPATQLKSSLDAIKTRLTHQIADLELEIATRQRITKDRQPIARDAEALILEERLKDLRQQRDEIFGKKELTDEQRINTAVKALERSVEAYEKRIAKNEPFPTKKPSKTPPSVQLDALKARRDALKQEIKLLQDVADIADPARMDAILNQAFATRTANRIADLQERLAKEDFSAKPRKPLNLTPASIKLQTQLAQVKEEYDLANFRRQRANRTIPAKILGVIGETVNLPKQLIASFDLSAILRQGGIPTISHPSEALKIFIPSMRALKSEEGFIAAEEAIKNHERYPYWLRAGLDLTTKTAGLAKMEETQMSRLASKIPGIRASERHYMTWMNLQRYAMVEFYANKLNPDGQLPTADEAKIIAHAVNVATGRGGSGMRAGALSALSTIFWAPRLTISRFQYLLGHPIWYGAVSRAVPFKGTGRVRWLLAKEYAQFLGKLLALYGLGLLMGGDVETDPRSSDFAKIRFGDTRVDPAVGLQQPVVLLSRLATGKTVDTGGRVESIVGDTRPYGGQTVWDVMAGFARTKLSPGISQLLALRSGETFVGEKVTPKTTARDLIIPLAIRDAYQAIESEGWVKGSALSALSIMGMGLSTYVSAGPKTRQVRKLTYAAEQAYAQKQTDQTRADQIHYDSIERTLKVYDVAAGKLRKDGKQNSPEAKAVRLRQEQLSAIALDGGRIWAKATPGNKAELKLAFSELIHARAQGMGSAEYGPARTALANVATGLKISLADSYIPGQTNARSYYQDHYVAALLAGDLNAAAAYFEAKRKIGQAPQLADIKTRREYKDADAATQARIAQAHREAATRSRAAQARP